MRFIFSARSTSLVFLGAFVLIQMTALGIGLLTMHRSASRLLVAETRAQAATEIAALKDYYQTGGLPLLKEAAARRLKAKGPVGLSILVRANGRLWGGGLTHWPEGIGRNASWAVISQSEPGQITGERLGIITTPLAPQVDLLVATSLADEVRLQRTSETAVLTAAGVGGLVAFVCAFLMLRILGARIDEFTEVAKAVQGGNLNRRWVRSGAADSFDRLGAAINAMLDRVARLVEELRMVTDSVAHDLRSPVTRLKTNLEQAIETVTEPVAREALASAIEEADSLHRMLDTALDITRTEAGIGRDQFSRFSIADLLDDIADVFGPLAEDRGMAIHVHTDPQLRVTGHRELLQRAMSNLVENAIKHAQGGTAIRLGGKADERDLILTVEDDGPGIPPNLREDAVRRFTRLDKARTSSGAGLGLSLVKTIATLHEGNLRLGTSEAGGLLVTLRLPSAVVAAEPDLPIVSPNLH